MSDHYIRGVNGTPSPALPDPCCPRCGRVFHCGVHDLQPCTCTGVDVPVAVLSALRARYTGCLCLACLREIAQAGICPDERPDEGPVERPAAAS